MPLKELNEIEKQLLGFTEQLSHALETAPDQLKTMVDQWAKVKFSIVQAIMAARLPDDGKMSPEEKKKLIQLYQNVVDGMEEKVIKPINEQNLIHKQVLKDTLKDTHTGIRSELEKVKDDFNDQVSHISMRPGQSSK